MVFLVYIVFSNQYNVWAISINKITQWDCWDINSIWKTDEITIHWQQPVKNYNCNNNGNHLEQQVIKKSINYLGDYQTKAVQDLYMKKHIKLY